MLEYRIIDNYSYEQYEVVFGIPATHKHHDQFPSSYLSISSTRHDLPSFSTVQPLLSTSSSLYLFSPTTTYLLRLPIPSLVPVLHSLFPINYSSYRRKRSRDCLALPQYPFSSQSVIFHGSTQHSYHCLCTRVLLIITPQYSPSHPSIPSIQMALTEIKVHLKRYPEHFFCIPWGDLIHIQELCISKMTCPHSSTYFIHVVTYLSTITANSNDPFNQSDRLQWSELLVIIRGI